MKGLSSVAHRTYEDIFELEAGPRRLLVLGGGPVGVELAQAFNRLGSAVTVLEQGARLLADADLEASEVVGGQKSDQALRVAFLPPAPRVHQSSVIQLAR